MSYSGSELSYFREISSRNLIGSVSEKYGMVDLFVSGVFLGLPYWVRHDMGFTLGGESVYYYVSWDRSDHSVFPPFLTGDDLHYLSDNLNRSSGVSYHPFCFPAVSNSILQEAFYMLSSVGIEIKDFSIDSIAGEIRLLLEGRDLFVYSYSDEFEAILKLYEHIWSIFISFGRPFISDVGGRIDICSSEAIGNYIELLDSYTLAQFIQDYGKYCRYGDILGRSEVARLLSYMPSEGRELEGVDIKIGKVTFVEGDFTLFYSPC